MSGMTKKIYSVLTVAVVLLMVCFLIIGYAALTDNLDITGDVSVEGKPYQGVYIKDVEIVSTSNAKNTEHNYILPTNLQTTDDASRSGGSVTYKITVHNNTNITYWFAGTKYDTSYANNRLLGSANGISLRIMDRLGDSYSTFNTDDWVPAQTERVFYVTYTYGSNAQSECTTLINYKFDIRIDAVHDEFLAVLNNLYDPGSYDYIVDVFEKEYASNGSKDITTESHPEVFTNLFDDLMVNINGIESKASVVIRRENMDNDVTSGDTSNGNVGCEYTLYITVEPLTPGTRPTVYAIAYSCGADGMGDDWYQVGELYEGTAPILSDGTIDYKNWIATHKNYEIADGIAYLVGAPNGDQYDIMKTMEQLISAEDQDIFNQIDNVNIFKKTYDIIMKHQGSDDPAIVGLRTAFYDAEKFYVNHNNGQEFKVVRNKYTRAEIIYALRNIQDALDYYYQVYGNS